MAETKTISEAFGKFAEHYRDRLEQVEPDTKDNVNNITKQFIVRSEKLRDDNSPMIFSHGEKTKDVIVLTHGLTDSPYYMQAIGERFYQEGLNVVLPLLPAHGLKDPDKAMEDHELDKKWRKEINQSVEVALLLGDRVSLGGFSTGGALSLNKILGDPGRIGGGLFLFSAAIDIGFADEGARSEFISRILQFVLKTKEGKLEGNGPNPFKYPELPESTGIELCQIIQNNEELLIKWEQNGKKISNPVFAAHSVHDETIKIECPSGIIHLLNKHVINGLAFLIAADVRHEEVVLAKNIELNRGPLFKKWKDIKQPKANPEFNLMMDTAIRFFNNYIIK